MKLQSSVLKKEKNLSKCKAEKQLSSHTSLRRDDIEYIANSLIIFSFDYNGFSFTARQFRCRPVELNSPLIMHEQLIISAHLGEIYWPHGSNKLSQNVHFTKEITPYLHLCSLSFFTVKE